MQKHWLLNLSTLQHGGSLQVAISLIEELKNYPNKPTLLLSKPLQESLEPETLQNFNHHLIQSSPARSKESCEKIIFLISEFSPKFIFTLFGPAYFNTPKSIPHLMGIGDGWVTHADKLAFSSLNFLDKIHTYLLCAYKHHYFKKATHWVTEAEIAKKGMIQKLKLPAEKITVIPNEISVFYQPYLNNTPFKPLPYISSDHPLKLLTFCSAYAHKNISILIPTALCLLKKNFVLFEFHLTLPKESREYKNLAKQIQKHQLENYFINHGPIPPQEGPRLYESIDALVFPSLLETYSVTPLEAICMGKPVFISDIPPHRALFSPEHVSFFNPLDPQSIADSILHLVKHPEQIQQKHILAKQWLQQTMSTRKSRTQAYLDLIQEIIPPSQYHTPPLQTPDEQRV